MLKLPLIAAALALSASIVQAGDPAPQTLSDPTPGLVGSYYPKVNDLAALAKIKGKPMLVRVDPQVNFAPTQGQFYNSKLANNFGVKWAGDLKVDQPGEYTLALRSDDASRLFIGDEQTLDTTKSKVNTDATAKVTFASAGTYPIRIEFQQGGGGSACVLSWMKPGATAMEPVPAAALVHEKSAEQIDWNKDAFARKIFSTNDWKEGGKADLMDYGPFLAMTLDAGTKNITPKAVVIKLNKNGTHLANIAFDTEMLRYSAGWTGGWLALHGVAFDGQHGPSPSPEGQILFASAVQLGGHEGTADDSFKDPRSSEFGTLSHDLGHYKGLYRNKAGNVLSYSIGSTDVLELPAIEMVGDQPVFTRTLQLAKSGKPLTLLACDSSADHPIYVFAPDPMRAFTVAGHQYVTFPPRSKMTTYKIALTRKDAVKPAEIGMFTSHKDDLAALIKGGPAIWGNPIETQGTLGKESGPYAVDTLTAPLDNPFHSWLRFGGVDFFPDGKSAALCTWSGDVWVVSGIDDSLAHLKWKRYATGLFQALGLKILNRDVYVLGRDQITRLHDLNNDGEADFYENFNNDCAVSPSFHEFTMDLQADSKGNFYYVKAGPVRPGGRGWQTITADNGAMLKVSADGKDFSVYASGLRAPNGMSVSPSDIISVADNEGTWTPACRIDYDVNPGDFLGVPDTYKGPKQNTTTPGKLLCWLPHGDVDNSSGGQVWVDSKQWGPFNGEMLALSYGKCSLFKVLKEEVDGTWQGGIVRFPLTFSTGICRARFNPADHQLYVAGLRGWQTDAVVDAALQRVRYTGKPVNMPTGLHIKPDGVEITCTLPLDPATAKDPQNYDVEEWNYLWSSDYGSPEMSVEKPKEKGHDPVDVDSVTLSNDNKTIFLKTQGLKPVMQMKIHMKIKAADNTPLDYSIYNTIEKIPGKAPVASAQN